ncbi:Imm1 family immunity protein [Streptomyces sp. NPDC048383]|uniref:Imm1 family immunity protein n=1 Tax=Streptomyces sp. NPDC048383 TaxID=3155386 RepID=UPI00344A29BE
MRAIAQARYRKEHGDNPVLLYTPEDVDGVIDALLDAPAGVIVQNLAQIHSLERDLLPSGFPDHELMVGVDKNLQVGLISFADDENYATLGNEDSRPGPVYFITGHDTYFPDNSEIPIHLVRQAVKEFVASGGQRPNCVQWQVDDL